MNLFYSVPEWVYKGGKLRYDELNQYFEEAYKMNCHNIKFNIGELGEVSNDDIEKLNELCEKYEIEMTVENDQTAENGRSEKIYDFLTKVKEINGKITFTFDTGNWLFQNEDPYKNAELLNSFVTYIHLKYVTQDRFNCLLDEGIVNWKKLLEILPNVPVAFEYPCRDKEQLQLEIDKVIKL